jgi:hypothetical protein
VRPTREDDEMRKLIFPLIVVVTFVIGCFVGSYLNDPLDSSSNGCVFKLNREIKLYQEGRFIGQLNSGAQLMCGGGTDEGFQRAVLILNYYEKTVDERYYLINNTNVDRLMIPCWSDQDVSPINTTQ